MTVKEVNKLADELVGTVGSVAELSDSNAMYLRSCFILSLQKFAIALGAKLD